MTDDIRRKIERRIVDDAQTVSNPFSGGGDGATNGWDHTVNKLISEVGMRPAPIDVWEWTGKKNAEVRIVLLPREQGKYRVMSTIGGREELAGRHSRRSEAEREASELRHNIAEDLRTNPEHSTIWAELVFEQATEVDRDDINAVSRFTEEKVSSWSQSSDARPNMTATDVFCLPGTERPEPRGQFFGTPPEQRIHCIVRFPDLQVPTTVLEGLKRSVARTFTGQDHDQERPPPVAGGRSFSNMFVIDEGLVRKTEPGLAGPPREDVEFIE